MREMKDSGVEWIGKIPKDWGIIPVKFCFSITNGSDPRSDEGDTPVYGSGKGHFKTCKEFKKGPTVLLGRKGTVNIPQWIEGNYWNVDTAFDVHAKGNYLLKLFFYAASCFDYDNYSTQTALPSMTQSNYLNFRIPFMNVEEQRQIVDFLDQKCSEIDALTADIQTQIETLEEYKKSVITEAVTKGLDPNVEMKDSGIQWVDKIPASWKVNKIKYISNSIFKGQGIKKEEVDINGDIQCVRYGEIYSKYSNSFNQCFSFINSNNLSRRQPFIKNGDIIFAITGELIEEIGKNILYTGELDCAVGGDIVVVRINEDRRFVNYALNSSYCQNQKSCNKFKLKVVHISAFEIGNILVLIPPLSIQKAISDFLDLKCAEIDQTISEKQQQLETLAEYKKSLIYEYVTGKKEVA